MKNNFILIVVALITNFTFAQSSASSENKTEQKASVEKSIFGIQLGLIGLYAYNEYRLSNNIALRSEIGFDLNVATIETYINGNIEQKKYYYTLPNISIEPRLYYDLNKRIIKGRNVKNNSGNFVSIRLNYLSSNYITSTNNNLILSDQFGIFGEWGIRRVYGKHFTLETGVGLGPVLYFGKTDAIKGKDIVMDAHVRLGYSF